jgi:chromosome segregation ATPase
LDGLEQRIERVSAEKDEVSRQLVALEEGRGQQAKRVAELQMETSDLRVRIDTVRGEIDNVEDRVRRLGTTVAETSAKEGERDERQRMAAEQQEMKMAALEREWKKWQKTLEDQDAQVAESLKRFVVYEETLRELKQLEKEVSQTLERFERRIHELAEMQRLAEERIKQEWTAFQADNQKKWNTQKLTFDEHWREHRREHDKLAEAGQSTGEDVSELALMLKELEAENKQKVSDLVDLIHRWATNTE